MAGESRNCAALRSRAWQQNFANDCKRDTCAIVPQPETFDTLVCALSWLHGILWSESATPSAPPRNRCRGQKTRPARPLPPSAHAAVLSAAPLHKAQRACARLARKNFPSSSGVRDPQGARLAKGVCLASAVSLARLTTRESPRRNSHGVVLCSWWNSSAAKPFTAAASAASPRAHRPSRSACHSPPASGRSPTRTQASPASQCIAQPLNRLARVRVGQREPNVLHASAQKPHGRSVGLIDRVQVAPAPVWCQMFLHVHARAL